LSIPLFSKIALATTYITDCTSITQPGEYVLANDISSGASTCIDIEADNVTLDCQGHTIGGFGSGSGIYVGGHNYVTIKNCVLSNRYYGIYLSSSSNNIISNNIINSNRYGIYLDSSSNNNTISNNNVNANSWSIYLSSSSNNIISNNTANDNVFDGIYLELSSNNIISNNIVNDNAEGGIILEFTSNNTISNNTANDNFLDGIYFYSSSDNIISNNIVNDNGYGIVLDLSSNNIISNNTANSNRHNGIYLYSSSNNTIYNNLFKNTNNVYVADSANYWNTTLQPGTNIVGGPYIGGNYWGSPDGTGFSDTCTDANYDGFCDNPYTLTTDNIDYLPIATPYLQVTPNYNAVNFGTLYPGTSNNPAPNQNQGIYNYTVVTNQNYKVGIYGNDFSDGQGHTLSITNLKVDAHQDLTQLSLSNAIQVKTFETTLAHKYGPGFQTLYFGYWLTVPFNTYPGQYSTTVYIDITNV